MNEAKAWAVVEDGQINVRSVCPTKIGAMVNFLWVDRQVISVRDTPDKVIEKRFEDHRKGAEVRMVKITVEEPK